MSLVVENIRWFPVTRRLWVTLTHKTHGFFDGMGLAALNMQKAIWYIWEKRLSWHSVMAQCQFVGVDALGMSLILTLFSGMVIALQMAKELTKQGAGEFVGALVSISILRELAPVMTGFSVIAMVGSAYAAELATMKIQKQVDALEVFHVDPIRYLVVPRLVAAMAMLPMMTILTAMAGIIGGMVVSYLIADLNMNNYMESVWRHVETVDITGAMLKSSVFGGLIALFSTTIGLNTRGGAKEVGMATTKAVVWSFVAMAIADYALSFMLFNERSGG